MLKKATKYLLYIILTNIIYGIILYNICTWLAGFSLLLAYFGNLVLIIIGLSLDEQNLKMMQSKKIIDDIKKQNEKNQKINFNLFQLIFESFISFKTILYVFYIFILIISEVISLNLITLNNDLEKFILANRYSILLLIALDQVIGQFSKDRKRIKGVAEKFNKNWTESQKE